MRKRSLGPAVWLIGLAGLLCASCAGASSRAVVIPERTRKTDSVQPGRDSLDLLAQVRDHLDPEARCRWSGTADLNRDGRSDIAYLFQRPGEQVGANGEPCLRSDLVLLLRRSDDTFDPGEAIVAGGVLGGPSCADSLPKTLPNLKVATGRISVAENVTGLDSMEQKLDFEWMDDEATWVATRAQERWRLQTGVKSPWRWVRHEVEMAQTITLEDFDVGVFSRKHFLVWRGWRMFARKVADLDLDGQPEVVYATEAIDVEGFDPKRFANGSRSLGLAKLLSTGEVQPLGANDKAIGGARTGGWLGDPFSSLEAGPGWFSLSDMSGAGTKLSRQQTFRWSKPERNWLLFETSTQVQIFHKDGADEPPSILTPEKFGKIPWTDYDADDFTRRFEN
ncbi:MAG: hypothetical protein IPK50_04660 [Fibrobacterota bacterium]|nr:MAG: hypothetical protein IPK50_04660 [Fibrobacterota bacterium]